MAKQDFTIPIPVRGGSSRSIDNAVQSDSPMTGDSAPPPPEDLPDALPPAYSGPSTTAPSYPSQATVPGLPKIPFSAYRPKNATISRDLRTTTVTNKQLCESSQQLITFVQEQVTLPPHIEVRIQGTHRDSWLASEIDFDIRINMVRYFTADGGARGLSYVQPASLDEKAPVRQATSVSGDVIKDSVVAFCAAGNRRTKAFYVTRKVTNWDTEAVTGRIFTLLAALNYKGDAKITFPVHHDRLAIMYTPENQGFMDTMRAGISGPEKYGLEVVWPYANAEPGEAGQIDSPNFAPRKCLVRSEEGWWFDWKGVIAKAVMAKRQGWVGIDDWIENAMTPVDLSKKPEPWGKGAV